MNQIKTPKIPLMTYYLIALAVVLLGNLFIGPMLAERQIKEVDYGTFMGMTQKKEIGQVEVKSNQIIFTDKDHNQIYRTGLMNDAGLVDRLYDAGAEFSGEIVQQASPLLSFLLSWLIPIGLFLLLGRYLRSKIRRAAATPCFSAEAPLAISERAAQKCM